MANKLPSHCNVERDSLNKHVRLKDFHGHILEKKSKGENVHAQQSKKSLYLNIRGQHENGD